MPPRTGLLLRAARVTLRGPWSAPDAHRALAATTLPLCDSNRYVTLRKRQ